MKDTDVIMPLKLFKEICSYMEFMGKAHMNEFGKYSAGYYPRKYIAGLSMDLFERSFDLFEIGDSITPMRLAKKLADLLK